MLKLKVLTKEEVKAHIEWAAPEGAKTVIADEKGMLRSNTSIYCSKGVEKESCMMYRIGKCCDTKKEDGK